ncbi:MAG: TolC family protein, partial [Lacunisphaera sp.]|nr:TolC family protein [Lacunisphaera sp.]
MTLRRFTSALLAATLAYSTALAQATTPAPAPAGPELTLEQCIARALARNFTLEIGRYAPAIAKDSIEIAQAGYQPQLSITGATGENSSPGFDSRSSNLRVGITQELYTGTTLSASSRLDRSSSDPFTVGALNPAYDADLTLSARQSLLRGFGTAINRANLDRAKIGLDRANLDLKATALDV